MTVKSTPRRTTAEGSHYVVAIGASAGGLEAIHEFFDNMPETTNLSFVIIQHLSPDYKSLLVDLVSRHTNMKVYEAENDIRIERGCVYVIPNNKFITIKDYKLVLTEKLPLKFPNNAIDVFMQSLAREMKGKGVAVILSGTGSDGSRGIKLVKEAGGVVMVQEPTSSKFDGMPNSAITTGHVDYILTPRDIPQQIIQHLDERELNDSEETLDDEMLNKIFGQLHQQAGFDLHYYKTPTISRRLFHRMRKADYYVVEEYYEFLKDNPEECKLLAKDLLINVTRFFRDTEAYDILKTQTLPTLINNRAADDPGKIWICACSTGEEAYSIAMVLDELLQESNIQGLSFKIFATDVEQSNIDIAARGFYPKTIEADVSKERLKKFFTRQDDGYAIIPRLRKQIVFATHNVLKDPPFIKNDLVTCRNMLIYMNATLQQRVYSLLLFALKTNGVMFLGPTENPNTIKQFLQELNAKWKIFKKTGDTKIAPILVGISDNGKSRGAHRVAASPRLEKNQSELWEELHETLTSDFNFAAFHIDRTFEIKEAIGSFDRLLSLPKKVLKLNLVRMLPGDISTNLIAEIKAAWKTGENRTVRNLHYKNNQKEFLLQVVIHPEDTENGKHYTTIAFQFMELASVSSEIARPVNTDEKQSEYMLSLEDELTETRGNLQHAIEDLQTANEELQSSNEELLSANEEMQSTNEELQSLNEELHTLNTEHQLKIKELVELNDDLNNYFRSSDIGQIFLDKNMSIRKFNPASVRMINLIESDIGRPITHISTNVRYPEFVSDIQQVQRSNEIIEKELLLQSGLNVLLRIMPYVTRDREISGVVVTFFDITAITNLNNIIRGVFNSSVSAIFAMKSIRDRKNHIIDFMIETTNHAGGFLLGKDPEEISQMMVVKSGMAPLLQNLFRDFISVVEKDSQLHIDHFDETSQRWYEVTSVKMSDGVVATCTDITQKKNAEDRLKRNYSELIATKENLKKLNNQLEVKVQERTKLLSDSEERFRMVARGTNDIIWDWDIVNNQIWVSDAFGLKLGYNNAQLMTRQEWIDKIHPSEQMEIDRSIHGAINLGKTQWTKEYQFRKADGEYCIVLDRAYIMQDDHGTPFRMLGSMLDITNLKHAEEEIANNVEQRKFLAESMPLIVLITSHEGKASFVNRQFEHYTGIESEIALNDGWKAVIHPADLNSLELEWSRARERKSDFQCEVRLRVQDGAYHWNILRAKARKDAHDSILNWVISTIDIEDQKEIHEFLEHKVEERTLELKRMNDALEVSNNDLQQFASVASHDLQEPLRKIHLYSSMILDRHSQTLGDGTQYLKKVLASTTRMKSIISNILNYSKLSAENVAFIPTDLNLLINEILEDLELSIQEKGAKVNVGKFPMIDTVPGQIRQVFQNMVGNALKFSRAGVAPVIDITSELVNRPSADAAADSNGAYCRIVIRDNGIGFDKKFAQAIFVLFQRLHSKDVYEGTGIGLAIAKKIIEKHRGQISASSGENEGATFIIVLPVLQQDKT